MSEVICSHANTCMLAKGCVHARIHEKNMAEDCDSRCGIHNTSECVNAYDNLIYESERYDISIRYENNLLEAWSFDGTQFFGYLSIPLQNFPGSARNAIFNSISTIWNNAVLHGKRLGKQEVKTRFNNLFED